MKMEDLLAQLKVQNHNPAVLAKKFEIVIRIINEIEPAVFDRIKIDAYGNPKKVE